MAELSVEDYRAFGNERKTFQHLAIAGNMNTQCETVYFPGLGNLTITYEEGRLGLLPVLSIDFDKENVRIIDMHGAEREIR